MRLLLALLVLPAFLPASPPASAGSYVGSQVCARCHQQLYAQFRRTAMGRSMAPAAANPELQALREPVRVYAPAIGRYFDVYRQGGAYYEKEYALGPGGRRLFSVAHRLTYAIGADLEGVSYLVRIGDQLYQAPLSFYRRTGKWAPSPGYDRHDLGFTRAATLACVACHSGRASPADVAAGTFATAAFAELPIGCEDCHGPGGQHAREWAAGRGDARYPQIVNPLRLSPRLAEDICVRCHQGADAEILQPGKTLLDFRPGQPLYGTLVLFNEPQSGHDPAKVLLAHVLSMRVSECYRASGGKLTCITCHDPHSVPAPAAAAAYYRRRCLTCHTEASCGLAAAARRRRQPDDSCIACHMPRRIVPGIGHAALTNHHILARSDEPLPPGPLAPATPDAPDLEQIDLPHGPHQPLDPVTLLRAYWQLRDTGPDYRADFARQLARCERLLPRDPTVAGLAAYADLAAHTVAGRQAAAVELAQAVGHATPFGANIYLALAQIRLEGRDPAGAAALLADARRHFPRNAQIAKFAVMLALGQGQRAAALAAARRYLELVPQDLSARARLAQLAGARP